MKTVLHPVLQTVPGVKQPPSKLYLYQPKWRRPGQIAITPFKTTKRVWKLHCNKLDIDVENILSQLQWICNTIIMDQVCQHSPVDPSVILIGIGVLIPCKENQLSSTGKAGTVTRQGRLSRRSYHSHHSCYFPANLLSLQSPQFNSTQPSPTQSNRTQLKWTQPNRIKPKRSQLIPNSTKISKTQ